MNFQWKNCRYNIFWQFKKQFFCFNSCLFCVAGHFNTRYLPLFSCCRWWRWWWWFCIYEKSILIFFPKSNRSSFHECCRLVSAKPIPISFLTLILLNRLPNRKNNDDELYVERLKIKRILSRRKCSSNHSFKLSMWRRLKSCVCHFLFISLNNICVFYVQNLCL